MSLVEIRSIRVLNPQSTFSQPLELEITFEALSDISGDLEFLVIFNATGDNEGDQELDKIVVGPIPKGTNQFSFTTKNAPSIVPDQELDSGIILIRVAYNDKKFSQVGFYVSIQKNPETGEYTKDVLVAKPRVTNFEIEWE